MDRVRTRDGGTAYVTRWDGDGDRPIIGGLLDRQDGAGNPVQQIMTWLPCGSYVNNRRRGCDLMIGGEKDSVA